MRLACLYILNKQNGWYLIFIFLHILCTSYPKILNTIVLSPFFAKEVEMNVMITHMHTCIQLFKNIFDNFRRQSFFTLQTKLSHAYLFVQGSLYTICRLSHVNDLPSLFVKRLNTFVIKTKTKLLFRILLFQGYIYLLYDKRWIMHIANLYIHP